MKSQDQSKLSEFQNYIGYNFNNPSILQQALTTPQLGNELNVPHYEILETLGDSVIKLIFSVKLYKELDVKSPGKLTQIKQSLESNETFIKIATEMELWKYIYASKNQNIKTSSILSDVLEAICGALYIDTNEDLAFVRRKIIDRFFKDWNEIIANCSNLAKNELLEFLQEKYNLTPSIHYQYIAKGAQHELQWIAKLPKIYGQNGEILIKLPRNLKSSPQKSKKEAEKELSKIIMDFLRKRKR
jgi:ribonuclease-3